MYSVLLSGSFLSVSLVVYRLIHKAASHFVTCPGSIDHSYCSESGSMYYIWSPITELNW